MGRGINETDKASMPKSFESSSDNFVPYTWNNNFGNDGGSRRKDAGIAVGECTDSGKRC